MQVITREQALWLWKIFLRQPEIQAFFRGRGLTEEELLEIRDIEDSFNAWMPPNSWEPQDNARDYVRDFLNMWEEGLSGKRPTIEEKQSNASTK